MSTSQLTSKTTPLTFSSHPLHLSFLLSSAFNITDVESILPHHGSPRNKTLCSTTPSNTLFSSNRLHRPYSLYQNILDSQLILNPLSSLATTRHYLISSTFMPHLLPNSLLTPTTSGSRRTSKHLNLSQAPRARLQEHHRPGI